MFILGLSRMKQDVQQLTHSVLFSGCTLHKVQGALLTNSAVYPSDVTKSKSFSVGEYHSCTSKHVYFKGQEWHLAN